MKKTILSLVMAAAIGLAGMTATSQPANAHAWWIIPAVIGGAVLVVGVAAAANASQPYPYGYQRNVYVQPTAGCYIERRQLSDGRLRRVRVCN
ncbi:MAG TPA: hypothetical protein VGM57_07665 [Pseudolabrys sp.]